jgi:hypothetical protein
MCNTIVGAGAGAASRYGSGSDQKMRLIAAPAPQHWFWPSVEVMPGSATHHTINASDFFILILNHRCCDFSRKSARSERRQAFGSAKHTLGS